jgi:sec-independent protein translocase protein TatC
LVKSAIAFCVAAASVGLFMKEFNQVLLWPLHHVQALYPQFVIDLGTTSIMEGFTVVIQMCAVGGLILALPFMLFFLGQFVSPALTPRESRMALPVCFAAVLLFLMGASFSFFLLIPSTIKVSIEINELLGFMMRWTPGAYYSLLTWMTLGVGVSFEFPLLILLAVHLGFVTVQKLRSWRRHMIVVVFIVAAIVTPTPDPVTQSMFAAPLWLLYEIAIIVGSFIQKRREKALAQP